MAKNTGASKFRRVDVDQYNEDNYQARAIVCVDSRTLQKSPCDYHVLKHFAERRDMSEPP